MLEKERNEKLCNEINAMLSFLEKVSRERHRQPLEVFWKKRCSKKFRKIHMKTPVPESLF